jgi:hypothetical protein
VILDVDLELVANETYAAERFVVPVSGYRELFEREVLARADETGFAFGRLDVSSERFLDEAILTAFRRRPALAVAALAEPTSRMLKRLVFRGSVGSDYGKWLRWWAERDLGDLLFAGPVTRNQLLDDDLAALECRDPESTEILQEYLRPRGGAGRVHRAPARGRARPWSRPPERHAARSAADERRVPALRRRPSVRAASCSCTRERSAADDARIEPFTRGSRGRRARARRAATTCPIACTRRASSSRPPIRWPRASSSRSAPTTRSSCSRTASTRRHGD